MAVVQNPIVGRAKNKFGNAIFSTWKGKNVLRTKPLEVSNPRSPAQVAQRNRLSEMVAMYRASKGAIDLGYKQQAIGRTEYNAFVADNMPFAVANSLNGEISVSYDDIMFAKGSLPPTAITLGNQTSSTASVSWSDQEIDYLEGQSATDVLSYVSMKVKAADGSVIRHTSGLRTAERTDGVYSCDVDNSVEVGTKTYLWVFFSTADGRKSSDSLFYELTQA